jgi:co-chaperonin GroES (HSP10)
VITPVLDRLLVHRINEKSEKVIIRDTDGAAISLETPDAYRQQSRKAVVVAVGQGVVLGREFFPLTDFVNVGDIVYVGEYNAEPVMLDGEELLVIRIQDVRWKDDGK